MRKVLSFFVLAGILLASSCSLKEEFKGSDSDFAKLSFTIGEPGTAATRAIGDGTSVDALYYAVYDDNGNFISDLAGNKTGISFPTTVEITLAKGQTYKIAFWAQSSKTGAYSFDGEDIRNINISYDGLNNDENRDAFFKAIDHKVIGDIALDVILERPFAQINLGVTQEDWDNAATAGISVAKSEITINNVASQLDIFNGKVSNAVPATYRLENIPTETLEVDYDKDGIKEAYKYLSLSYILVYETSDVADEEGMFGAGSSLVNATFKMETNKAPVEIKVDNMPVRRNWRTNIIGEVLTGDITFNIDVDPIFDGDEIYPDTDLERLHFAAQNGGEVTLNEDITLDKRIDVYGNMIINLNGHSIINSTAKGTQCSAIIAWPGSNLIINGEGTVQANCTDTDITNITLWAYGGNVTINGGYFTNTGAAEVIYASNKGIVDIYGGKFEAKDISPTAFAEPQYCVLNLYGNGDDGCNIHVYGGTFVKFNPSDNVSENPKKDFVEKGYYSVAKGEDFIVVENPADVLVSNLEELKSALNAATGNVIIGLIGNIAGDVTVEQKPDVKITIEGNGHKYDGTIIVNGKSARYATAGLTIQNINFKSENISADAYINLGSGDNSTRYTSNVIVRNCTFEGYANKPVAVKSYTGGDHNIAIIGCTVDNKMHSLAQLTNVEVGLQIKDCKVYSKNGANLNNSPALEMNNCIFDVTGYAVRVGVNSGVNGEQKAFAITNSTLKSACAESDDAVLVFRSSATNAKVTLTNTTLEGTRTILGNTDQTIIKY